MGDENDYSEVDFSDPAVCKSVRAKPFDFEGIDYFLDNLQSKLSFGLVEPNTECLQTLSAIVKHERTTSWAMGRKSKAGTK